MPNGQAKRRAAEGRSLALTVPKKKIVTVEIAL
jgi:hypothetical protein